MFFYLIFAVLLAPDFYVSGCLQCHQHYERKLEEFRIFLSGHHKHVTDFKKLHAHITKGITDITDRLASLHLDKFAISQMTEELETLVKNISTSVVEGTNIMRTVESSLEQLRETFSAILAQFLSERFCPNLKGDSPCGLIIQTLTTCKTCEAVKVPCAGGYGQCKEKISQCPLCFCNEEKKNCKDLQNGRSCKPCGGHDSCLTEILKCKDHFAKVTEGQDLILDCHLNWHAKMVEPIQYVFSQVEKDTSKTLNITDQPFLVKRGVGLGDAGDYMCTAQLKTNVPVSTHYYRVKVLLQPGKIPDTAQTLVNAYVEHKITIVAQIATAVCSAVLVISVIGIMILNYKIRKLERAITEHQEALVEGV